MQIRRDKLILFQNKLIYIKNEKVYMFYPFCIENERSIFCSFFSKKC